MIWSCVCRAPFLTSGNRSLSVLPTIFFSHRLLTPLIVLWCNFPLFANWIIPFVINPLSTLHYISYMIIILCSHLPPPHFPSHVSPLSIGSRSAFMCSFSIFEDIYLNLDFIWVKRCDICLFPIIFFCSIFFSPQFTSTPLPLSTLMSFVFWSLDFVYERKQHIYLSESGLLAKYDDLYSLSFSENGTISVFSVTE